MTKSRVVNLPASIRNRLLALARTGEAYSVETIVAEKFEAMISLALVNGRLKDFFDVHQLAHAKAFDGGLSRVQPGTVVSSARNRSSIAPSHSGGRFPSLRKSWSEFVPRCACHAHHDAL